MMSDQNFDNKDKVEILPNGVKVIWQFYKPKKEKAFDPQSSDKSQEDSKDSYGNRASAGKRASTKSSSRSGYSARSRAGASAGAGAGASAGGKSNYKSKSTAYKSKKSAQEPTAYSGFAKENHHYDSEVKFNHSQFNAVANQSVSKQSRTSQNSYSRANQPSTKNDYMANNYQGYGQGSVRPAQAQATAPAIATASANARATTPNSLQVAPNNSAGYSPNYMVIMLSVAEQLIKTLEQTIVPVRLRAVLIATIVQGRLLVTIRARR